jgi:trehalose 6-phosphate synthase
MTRLVVISNRVPVPSDGTPSAGGLATALDGLLARRGGLWFGWSGKVDAAAADQEPQMVRRGEIDLTRTEHDRYYNNFSNGVLWPLLHTLPELMNFNRRDAAAYAAVNQRFAHSVLPLLRPDDVIWIHDYHLMALPALLRAAGVRNAIGFFLHIPFCGPSVITQVPHAAELVGDLLSADLVGFQTHSDMAHFRASACMLAGAAGAGETAVPAAVPQPGQAGADPGRGPAGPDQGIVAADGWLPADAGAASGVAPAGDAAADRRGFAQGSGGVPGFADCVGS